MDFSGSLGFRGDYLSFVYGEKLLWINVFIYRCDFFVGNLLCIRDWRTKINRDLFIND